MVRKYNGNQIEESFSIYQGSSTISLLSISGKWSNEETYKICLQPEVSYTIHYNDRHSNGWNHNSYVKITYQDRLILRSDNPYGYIYGRSDEFAIHECQSNDIEATLTRHYSSNAHEELIQLYQSSSNKFLTIMGLNSDNYKSISYPICIKPNVAYTIYYYDHGKNGWSSGSYVEVSYQNYTIFKGSLEKNVESDYISKTNSFIYTECSSNQKQGTLTRHYSSYPYQETISLYKGTSSSGPHMVTIYGTSSDTSSTH